MCRNTTPLSGNMRGNDWRRSALNGGESLCREHAIESWFLRWRLCFSASTSSRSADFVQSRKPRSPFISEPIIKGLLGITARSLTEPRRFFVSSDNNGLAVFSRPIIRSLHHLVARRRPTGGSSRHTDDFAVRDFCSAPLPPYYR